LRLYKTIEKVIPADKYFGRDQLILENRKKIKNQTIRERRRINISIMMENLPNEIN